MAVRPQVLRTAIDAGAASHSFGSTTVTAPTYDIAGMMRPQGAGFDIGPYEAM